MFIFFAVERESSCQSSRSHPGLSGDDFFSTPKVICQETVRQKNTPNLDKRNSNNLFQWSTNPFLSDFSQEEVGPKHLDPESFNDEKTASSEFTIPDLDEIEILRMQLVEQESINKKLQKEGEERIIKAFEEK